MAFKIKAWMIYLICIGITVPIGLVSGDGGLTGSLMAEVMIWGGVGLGIHYLVRNAGNKEIMIYGIVAVPLVLGFWYVAFAFGTELYFIYAIGITIAVTVNGIHHSVKRMLQKK